MVVPKVKASDPDIKASRESTCKLILSRFNLDVPHPNL
jgi:hypothetical protein